MRKAKKENRRAGTMTVRFAPTKMIPSRYKPNLSILSHCRECASSKNSSSTSTEQGAEEDETSATMTATAGSDCNHHLLRRGSSTVSAGGPSPSLTVTKNVNGSSAVSEEQRVQASDYLASYIKVLCFSVHDRTRSFHPKRTQYARRKLAVDIMVRRLLFSR